MCSTKIWPALVAAAFILFPFYAPHSFASGIIQLAYQVIQDEGSSLTRFNVLNFTGAGITCSNGSGKTVCDVPSTPATQLVRTCIVVTGDPGAASPVLADDNDSPQVCKNKTGATMTITSVSCYADAGSPTVTPILSGGGATSILTGALTCSQTAGGAAGTVNGSPALTSNLTIDSNITTAGGTAKYIVVTIGMTL